MNILSKILTLIFVIAFISSCQKYAPLETKKSSVNELEFRSVSQDNSTPDDNNANITDPDEDDDFDSDKDEVITDPDEDEDFDSEVEGIKGGGVILGGSVLGNKPGSGVVGQIND